jgi:hypothetical protein
MAELQTIELNKNIGICSFDIANMYINIPKIYAINIICNMLGSNQEINMNIQKETLHILQTAMEQNYFQFDRHKQTDVLATGPPTT